MYPPLPFIDRRCTEDYVIPNTNITIDKGTITMIPVLGLHNDEEFFPEPNTFNPNRFNEENVRNIKPYTYLPFGDGPRNCLGKLFYHFLILEIIFSFSGLRFGVIQTKISLAVLLNHFEFTVNQRTKMPIKFDSKSFFLKADDGIWLSAKRL